ncbi:MAG TPA: HepT-like ribonuclease domain-containing protein [Thermodesulfovibrionia bacterium]|nr:HepT-like ribonuclease domain-containing protein [Thermodesulfovibrionia bacterium]
MSVKERWKKAQPIKFSTTEALSRIVHLFKTDSRIFLVFLFGSRSKGKADWASDIDIAFYTSREFTWNDYYLLFGNTTQLLHSDRLDLVWLNCADSVLKFEILQNGRLVYCQNEDIFYDFNIKTKWNFYDYSIYLKKHTREEILGYRKESLIKRIALLKEYQHDLESFGTVEFDVYIKEKKTKYAIERLLFLICETILDVLDHVLSSRFSAVSDSYEDIIEKSYKNGIIDKSVYSHLKGIGGFRNILAHEYFAISDTEVFRNFEKMKGILAEIIQSFENLVK